MVRSMPEKLLQQSYMEHAPWRLGPDPKLGNQEMHAARGQKSTAGIFKQYFSSEVIIYGFYLRRCKSTHAEEEGLLAKLRRIQPSITQTVWGFEFTQNCWESKFAEFKLCRSTPCANSWMLVELLLVPNTQCAQQTACRSPSFNQHVMHDHIGRDKIIYYMHICEFRSVTRHRCSWCPNTLCKWTQQAIVSNVMYPFWCQRSDMSVWTKRHAAFFIFSQAVNYAWANRKQSAWELIQRMFVSYVAWKMQWHHSAWSCLWDQS